MTPKIKIGKNANVEVNISMYPSEYSRELEQNIIHKIAKKYGISPSKVKLNISFITNSKNDCTSLNAKNIESIHDPKFQQHLFEEYMVEHGINKDDYDYDYILNIDSQVNSHIDYNKYERGRRYSINWLKWSNFLSYGPDNFFDFRDLKGLVLLNSEPANQGGKSTFAYDLLHFLFFGKTKSGKGKTLDKLFNNYLPDETELFVEGSFTINNEEYIIRRKLIRPDRNKKTKTIQQTVEYFHVVGENITEELVDIDNLQDDNSVKTNKIIKEAIGNEDDFDMIISANSKDLDGLISLKDTEKGKLLHRWNGLSVIEDKFVLAKDIFKQSCTEKYSKLYSREEIKHKIEGYNKSIIECTNTIDNLKKKLATTEQTIQLKTQEKEQLLEQKQNVDASLCKLDYVTEENKLNNIMQNGINLKAQKEALEAEILAMVNIEGNFNEIKNKIKSINHEITDNKVRITKIDSEIIILKKDIKKLQSAEYCPTCKRKFDDDKHDFSKEINANEVKISELQQTKALNEEKLVSLSTELSNLESVEIELDKKNKKLIKLSILDKNIVEARNSYTKQKNILNELKKNEFIIKENNKINNELNIINECIKTEERIKTKMLNDITSTEKDIETIKNSIIESKVIISKLEEEEKALKNWKLYLEMIGKDGIGKMVLKNTIPIINNELDRLLYDICDFSVKLEINDKNDVDFFMIRDGVKTYLTAGSGYERCVSAMSLRVVLGSMSKLSRPPFILFDEVLGAVAKENYDKVKKLYDKIIKNYDFIFQITHLDDITDWHNTIITIQKENNISKIKKIVQNTNY